VSVELTASAVPARNAAVAMFVPLPLAHIGWESRPCLALSVGNHEQSVASMSWRFSGGGSGHIQSFVCVSKAVRIRECSSWLAVTGQLAAGEAAAASWAVDTCLAVPGEWEASQAELVAGLLCVSQLKV